MDAIKNRVLFLMATVSLIGICVMLSLAGCSNLPTNAGPNLAEVKAQVQKACGVFTPVSASVEAMYVLDPKILALGAGVKGVCAAQDAIDPTNLKTLVNSTFPAALAALKGVASPAVSDALLIAQVALAAALAAYGPAPSASTPAAAPASSPLAGAPL